MSVTFSATRLLPANPTRVWELLTVPEQFAIWFGTDQVHVPLESLELDVRAGGKLRAIMELPDGGTIHWRGEYVEVSPPTTLSLRLTDQPDDDLGLPVVFSVAEAPGGSEITVVQDRGGFSDEQVEMTIAGYGSFFATMESMLRAE